MTRIELEALAKRVDEVRWSSAPFMTAKAAMHRVGVPKEWQDVVYSLVLGIRLAELED